MKSPNIKSWLYYQDVKYKNRISNLKIGRNVIAGFADYKWRRYTINKVRETAETLGYILEHRTKVSDYQYKHNPKIKIGKFSYTLLPKNPPSKEKSHHIKKASPKVHI